MAPTTLAKAAEDIRNWRNYPTDISRRLRIVPGGRLMPQQTLDPTTGVTNPSPDFEAEHHWANAQGPQSGPGGSPLDEFHPDASTTLKRDGAYLTSPTPGPLGATMQTLVHFNPQDTFIRFWLRVDHPHASDFFIGAQGPTDHVGLFLHNDANGIRFRYRNLEPGEVFYQFETVIPVGTPDAPKYSYVVFYKSNGSLRLWIDGTLDSATFDSVPVGTDLNNGWRFGLQGAGFREVFIPNYKGFSFGSGDTPPMTFDTPWASPVIFDASQDFSPRGTIVGDWFDGGAAGVYWDHLVFFDISRPGLSDLQIRWYATDTLPGADDTSGLFTGPFTTPQNDQPIAMSNPQGRYLALQFRFDASTLVDKNGDIAWLQEVEGDVMRIVYDPDAPLPAPDLNPIGVTLLGETDSEATLPFAPEFPGEVDHRELVARHEMSFPYVVTSGLQTRGRGRYPVRWILDETDRDTLLAFLDARRGGEGTFTYTDADLVTRKASMTSDAPTVASAPGGKAFQVDAVFEEIVV